MTCPSNKSLLVYCCSILLLNGTIIASRGTHDQQAAGTARETKKGSDLRSSIPSFLINPLIATTAITKDLSSPSPGKRDCKQLNGRPGKCFPPESCLEWSFGPEVRQGWNVCEWLHEPIASPKVVPPFLMIQQKQPLTLCCQEPALLMAKSPMRQLTQSFYEIPKRKANMHLHGLNKQCGSSFPSIFGHFHPLANHWLRRKRMVYGHSTTAHDHPWMAVLLVNGQFRCGGSLLSDRAVITSAHCLWSHGKRNSSQQFEIMVGSTDLGSGTVYQVLRTVRHPESSRESVMNDIALLITAKPIVFSDDVNPICFPSASMGGKALQGLRATMTGFGTYYYGKCCCCYVEVESVC